LEIGKEALPGLSTARQSSAGHVESCAKVGIGVTSAVPMAYPPVSTSLSFEQIELPLYPLIVRGLDNKRSYRAEADFFVFDIVLRNDTEVAYRAIQERD